MLRDDQPLVIPEHLNDRDTAKKFNARGCFKISDVIALIKSGGDASSLPPNASGKRDRE